MLVCPFYILDTPIPAVVYVPFFVSTTVQVCVGEKNIEVRPSGCPAPSILQVALARMQLEADEQSAAGVEDIAREQQTPQSTLPPMPQQPLAPDVLNEVLSAVQSGAGEDEAESGDGRSDYKPPKSADAFPSMSPLQGGVAADVPGIEPAPGSGVGTGLGNVGNGSLGSLESAQQQHPTSSQVLPVDFVLYVASGDDMTDEDIFGEMV